MHWRRAPSSKAFVYATQLGYNSPQVRCSMAALSALAERGAQEYEAAVSTMMSSLSIPPVTWHQYSYEAVDAMLTAYGELTKCFGEWVRVLMWHHHPKQVYHPYKQAHWCIVLVRLH
jgi:hypothetical protein